MGHWLRTSKQFFVIQLKRDLDVDILNQIYFCLFILCNFPESNAIEMKQTKNTKKQSNRNLSDGIYFLSLAGLYESVPDWYVFIYGLWVFLQSSILLFWTLLYKCTKT